MVPCDLVVEHEHGDRRHLAGNPPRLTRVRPATPTTAITLEMYVGATTGVLDRARAATE